MASTRRNGFYWKEWPRLEKMLPLKGMVSAKKNIFQLKGALSLNRKAFR